MSKKIGQGGFGAVYYAELRGEVSSMFKLLFQLHIIISVHHLKCFALGCLQKAAIKKMDMQASHEFLAELKVLTHVHHLNLVSDFFLFTATTYLICDFPFRFVYYFTFSHMKSNIGIQAYIYVWSTCYSDVQLYTTILIVYFV
jgi:serine/threonine protein kinase